MAQHSFYLKKEQFGVFNVGGTLGVFLGMSFLSFIEIVEIIFEIFNVMLFTKEKWNVFRNFYLGNLQLSVYGTFTFTINREELRHAFSRSQVKNGTSTVAEAALKRYRDTQKRILIH